MIFLPNISQILLADSVVEEFKRSLEEAQRVRGVVAYWTIGNSHELYGELLKNLSKEESYVCVDISTPTNLDVLCELVEEGANIYLFLARRDDKKLPRLLHTKAWLFEGTDSDEIMVGSHNFTTSALGGNNIELSIRQILSRTNQNDHNLKIDFENYLENIMGFCDKFDPTKIEEYKFIQEQKKLGSDVQVIIIHCDDIDDLKSGDSLYVLSPSTKPKDLFFYAIDSAGRIRTFKGNTTTQGVVQLNRNETYDIDFKAHRNFILNIDYPRILNTFEKKLDQNILKYLESFQLTFLEEVNKAFTTELTLPKIWETVRLDSPLGSNLGGKKIQKANIGNAMAHLDLQRAIENKKIDQIIERHDIRKELKGNELVGRTEIEAIKNMDRMLLDRLGEIVKDVESIGKKDRNAKLNELIEDHYDSYDQEYKIKSKTKHLKSPFKAMMIPKKGYKWE